MSAILTLTLKDLRTLLRDRAGVFFVLGFPLIFALFFGTIFSAGSDAGRPASRTPIALVDEDQTGPSRALVEVLHNTGDLEVLETERAEALEAVQRARRSAAVILPAGFGAARENLFTGGAPRVQVAVDPSRSAEAAMLEGVLTRILARELQSTLTDPARMTAQVRRAQAQLRELPASQSAGRVPLERFLSELEQFVLQLPPQTPEEPPAGAARAAEAPAAGLGDGDPPSAPAVGTAARAEPSRAQPGFRGFEPVQFERIDLSLARRPGPRNAYAISFPQGILWGVLSCAAAFGISLVSERQRGTLRRLRAAPLTYRQILAGKALACLASTLLVIALLLTVAMIGFGVRPTSWGLLIAAAGSIAVGFVGLMMLLAVLGRSEQSAAGIGWAVLTLLAMIGGGMVPIFLMPAWMQQAAGISPVKWAILALEGALWRDFTPAMMLQPCAILVVVGVFSFLLGATLFRRSQG
jgi:ABC-2 type transport system permease protein